MDKTAIVADQAFPLISQGSTKHEIVGDIPRCHATNMTAYRSVDKRLAANNVLGYYPRPRENRHVRIRLID